MIDRSILRLLVSIAIPLASGVVVEQLPKTRLAQVPFQFQVGDRILPPGTYKVRGGGLGRDIRFQNEKFSSVAWNCASAKSKFGRAQPARLVFDSQDGQYRLAEIWFETDGRGLLMATASGKSLPAAEAKAAGEAKCVWLR